MSRTEFPAVWFVAHIATAGEFEHTNARGQGSFRRQCWSNLAGEVYAGDAGPILQSGVDDEDSSKTTSGGIIWGFSVQSRSLSS